ncbi:MAG: F0F1 ATP synthase subunit gamma [Bacilli bacterium]
MGKIKDLEKEVKALKKTKKVIHINEISTMSRINQILRRADKSIGYQKTVLSTLKQLSNRIDTPMNMIDYSKPKLLIVITSNRGFCGSYNFSVIEKVNEVICDNNDGYQLYVIGKQGYKQLKNNGYDIAWYSDKSLESITIEDTTELTSRMLQKVVGGEISSVDIVYTNYDDALNSTVTNKCLFPLEMLDDEDEDEKILTGILDFEEAEEDIIFLLSQNYLCGMLYNLLLSSLASEYCARRMAMFLARKSIENKLKTVTKVERKERTQSSTKELFGIISSAEVIGESENE